MRRPYFAYVLLAIFLLSALFYLVVHYLGDPGTPETKSAAETTAATAPVFTKEGEVTFVREGQVLGKIDVEVAENEAERNKGLMYRPYLPDSTGMLFIFEESGPLGFWMKNTQIPLDIIYADRNKRIVSIQKNARPYSEESLPSERDAQYVVEVNAGYVDRYGIAPGDEIRF